MILVILAGINFLSLFLAYKMRPEALSIRTAAFAVIARSLLCAWSASACLFAVHRKAG